ncbi:recombinase family protein [Brevibacillus invocatus]|uniref:Recombinase family protein n=1 Tax=Brevibacillus invocatus TaxID=173959 RepID=A0A3M8BS95_9BACL|nr:recombinase family protein [Brevibacillus invocatus]RNB66278.1 recombinase family protein [Brevibacillus invocatus]
MIFGYARVSTEDQNLDMQIDALNKYGVERIFQEKMTGTKKDRPQLDELLKLLRKGDKVVVYKLDRISRSTKHLIELSEQFNEMAVDFVSLSDSIDTSTAMGKFFFRTMASIAELERDIISERTKSGLQAARARGKKGGRPSKQTDKVEMALKMYDSKDYSIAQIISATGLGKTTLYRYISTR